MSNKKPALGYETTGEAILALREEHLSHIQIAERLGTTEKSVRRQVARLVSKARENGTFVASSSGLVESPWTDDVVEQLKRFWGEGLSCGQIASALGSGITRNAVIGKVSRLKLPQRLKSTNRAASRPRTRSPASQPIRAARVPSTGRRPPSGGLSPVRLVSSQTLSLDRREPAPLPRVQEIVIPEAQRLTLLQLTEHTCKWPLGDPLKPDFYFCGGHAEEGRPYCSFHVGRAYHPLDKKVAR